MLMGIGGPALALRKFSVSGAPSKEEAPVIEIEGRKPGLIGFFLTLIGIDASTSLIVTPRDIRFRKGSLFGEMTSMMPLTAVATAHAGYAKPIGYLILAGIVLVFSVGSAGAVHSSMHRDGGTFGALIGFMGVVLALVLVVAYFLSRKMAIFVESSGGATFGVIFKRSVIEGVTVDIAKVKSVVDIIRELVIACQQRVG